MQAVTLKSGSHGIFEVALDGEVVFSNRPTDRIPEAEEVEGILEQKGLGPALDWK